MPTVTFGALPTGGPTVTRMLLSRTTAQPSVVVITSLRSATNVRSDVPLTPAVITAWSALVIGSARPGLFGIGLTSVTAESALLSTKALVNGVGNDVSLLLR